MCLSVALFVMAGAALAKDGKAKEPPIAFRQVTSTHPVAVERGTTSEVKLRSNFTLDGAYAVFFDKPGLAMKFMETEPIKAPRKGRFSSGTPFRFEVTVPEDQATGRYEYRVATETAVSSVAQLLVTDYAVVLEEKKENGTSETAQPVTTPAAVCGICEKFEDVDCFRVSGRAGQHVTIQVYAQRVTDLIHNMDVRPPATYLMNALLTLYGPGGRMIAQNDNFFGADPFIACTLPESGDYTVEIRDARYAGSERYSYCIEISDRPFAYGVFPMAVQRGASVEAEVIGFELPGSRRTTLSAAADEAPGWKDLRIETPAGPTNPVPICVTDYPNIVLPAVSTSREAAVRVALPVGVNGHFREPDEAHYISFEAKKGRYYRFEVESHRRGLPLDAVIEISNAAGEKLSDADDDRYSEDPTLNFRAPKDGTYFASVRDLHGRCGERFVYHLRVLPSGPDFELDGQYYYAMLAPGTHAIWFTRLNRLNGFVGPVEIHVDGLPKGVSAMPVTIPQGLDKCAVILSADADAPVNASLAHLYGKAVVSGPDGSPHEIVREGRVTCEQQTSGGGLVLWPIHTQLVGVIRPADVLKVEATPDEIALEPGGTAEINVRIERREGFKEPVQLGMTYSAFSESFGAQLPKGVKIAASSQVRLVGDDLQGKIVLQADAKVPPMSRFPIAVVARVGVTFAITANYGSNPVYLTIPAGKVAQSK